MIVGETWSGRATRWSTTNGSYLGSVASLYYPLGLVLCGSGTDSGLVAAEYISNQYGACVDPARGGHGVLVYGPSLEVRAWHARCILWNGHVTNCVSDNLCACLATCVPVVVRDGQGGRREFGAPAESQDTFHQPVSLALLPGWGMVVLQRQPTSLVLLTSLSMTSSGPDRPLAAGETALLTVRVKGPTRLEGVVFRWSKAGVVLAEGPLPILNYTVAMDDLASAPQVTILCVGTHALGRSFVTVGLMVAGPSESVTASPVPSSLEAPPIPADDSPLLSSSAITGLACAVGALMVGSIAAGLLCARRRGRVNTVKAAAGVLPSSLAATVVADLTTSDLQMLHTVTTSTRRASPHRRSSAHPRRAQVLSYICVVLHIFGRRIRVWT